MSISVKFWGVRGSIACPGAKHITYGGNTSCVEVKSGGAHIILDAGTGIRELGHAFMKDNVREATLLLSHTHWDHISGFPFFQPAFNKDCHFHVRAGHLTGMGIGDVLASQMTHPFFPVPLETLRAKFTFEDFSAGEVLDLPGGIRARTAPLNHPDGATGYRLEKDGKSVCYVTDTEHRPGSPDEVVLDLIAGADLVIYDSTYTDEEYKAHIGWGHSTWQEGMRLCQAAGVKRFAIFHHDPDHDDVRMAEIEEEARDAWTGCLVAREGMALAVG